MVIVLDSENRRRPDLGNMEARASVVLASLSTELTSSS